MKDRRIILKHWRPAMNKWHDQTGVAHRVLNTGEILCGTPHRTLGGAFQSPEDAGCVACQKCMRIVQAAQKRKLAQDLKPRPPGYYI